MSKLILTWLVLLGFLALEVGASFLPLSPSTRPLILIPALAMLGIVVTSFMQIGRGPVIVRLFAAAGVLWLLILLALGSLDPLTRVVYRVER
jgi:cytochrome c oxidase subunit 4